MDEIIEKKSRIRTKHVGIVLGVSALLFVIIRAVLAGNSQAYKIEEDKVIISPIIREKFQDYVSVIGTVEPITTIYLDAIEGGQVEEIVIEEGSMVKKGDVILKLSNSELNLSILTTEAQLAEQINFLRNTQIQMEQERIRLKQERLQLTFDLKKKYRAYERNKTMLESEFISKEEFLLSKEDYELTQQTLALVIERQLQDSLFRQVQVTQMNHNLEKMRMNLELVHQRLDNLNVKAPGDGQLGLLDAVIGQNIGKGQRLGQINVLSDYKVVAEIDEHYIDRVKTQLPASVEKNKETHSLQIKKVYPEVRNGQFEIDLTFTSPLPENIRTGQTYHINLELGKPKDAILLPRGGFFLRTGGQWVFVLDQSGAFALKRNVKLGKQNPRYYEVVSGLEPGEKVITSSYEVFGDANKVELTP